MSPSASAAPELGHLAPPLAAEGLSFSQRNSSLPDSSCAWPWETSFCSRPRLAGLLGLQPAVSSEGQNRPQVIGQGSASRNDRNNQALSLWAWPGFSVLRSVLENPPGGLSLASLPISRSLLSSIKNMEHGVLFHPPLCWLTPRPRTDAIIVLTRKRAIAFGGGGAMRE